MSQSDVKFEQHAKYDKLAKQVMDGEIKYKPAVKSRYSASSTFVPNQPVTFG